MKKHFFQAFSYLQNEKHIFRAFSKLQHGNHLFELFFSFKKWKSTFFKFTKWKKSKFLKRFSSSQYRHSSDESLQHRKIRTDAGVKFWVWNRRSLGGGYTVFNFQKTIRGYSDKKTLFLQKVIFFVVIF